MIETSLSPFVPRHLTAGRAVRCLGLGVMENMQAAEFTPTVEPGAAARSCGGSPDVCCSEYEEQKGLSLRYPQGQADCCQRWLTPAWRHGPKPRDSAGRAWASAACLKLPASAALSSACRLEVGLRPRGLAGLVQMAGRGVAIESGCSRRSGRVTERICQCANQGRTIQAESVPPPARHGSRPP